MASILLIGVPTGIIWGIIAGIRKKGVVGIILCAIIGAALWAGFVVAINMIMPADFERSMLRQMADGVFSLVFIFIPAGVLSIGIGLGLIPKVRRASIESTVGSGD